MNYARAVLIAIKENGGDVTKMLVAAIDADRPQERVIQGLGEFITSALAGVVIDPENL